MTVNSKLLRDIIASKGLKQKFIADKIGISEDYLSKKIAGSLLFKKDEAKKLQDVLALSDSEMLHIFLD